MSSQELLENYGKAANVVKDFYLGKFLDSMEGQDLPENFKDFAREQGIDNDTVAKMIDAMPRALFDVFDANEVMISVKYSVDGFTWHITQLPFSEIKDTTVYTFRKDAETAAIKKAFEILNDKL